MIIVNAHLDIKALWVPFKHTAFKIPPEVKLTISIIMSAPLDAKVMVTNLRKAGSGRGSLGKALALSTMFQPARLSL